jgi:hypothetical protein
MSMLRDSRRMWTVGVMFLAMVAVSAQEREQLSLAAAAERGSVEEFASALVREGTAVGLVVRAADVGKRSLSVAPPGPRRSIAVPEALAAFGTRHNTYRSSRKADGSVTIAPRTPGPCTEILERTARQPIQLVGRATEVLQKLYWLWQGRTPPSPSGGVVGSEVSRSDAHQAIVTVNVFDDSLEAALDQLVLQAGGLGWAAREIDDPRGSPGNAQACNLTLFTGDVWLFTPNTFVPPQRGRQQVDSATQAAAARRRRGSTTPTRSPTAVLASTREFALT